MTPGQLIKLGIPSRLAQVFSPNLNEAFVRFDISTPQRVSAFLAQAIHESAGFTELVENLNYTKPERVRELWPTRVTTLADAATLCRNPQALANRVYANRGGNRDEASGDGFKFRGRGIFQLTFKNNYADAALELDRDYLTNPDIVALPPDACLTAAWYWHCNKLNLLADKLQLDAIRRAVNGPKMVGAIHCRQLFDQCMECIA